MPETTERLRRKQAARVMPLVGPLIDAWDQMPNDLKGDIEDYAETFTIAMHAVIEAMEAHHYD